jgi:hypothetical protein
MEFSNSRCWKLKLASTEDLGNRNALDFISQNVG